MGNNFVLEDNEMEQVTGGSMMQLVAPLNSISDRVRLLSRGAGDGDKFKLDALLVSVENTIQIIDQLLKPSLRVSVEDWINQTKKLENESIRKVLLADLNNVKNFC